MPTARTGSAGVVRRHGNQMPTTPRQLVVQLAAEFAPALVEDGAIQAGLLADLLAVLFNIAFAGFGHIPYLQIFDAHDRVVLADFGFRLFPVLAELHFPRHAALIAFQPLLVFFEAIERVEVAAV